MTATCILGLLFFVFLASPSSSTHPVTNSCMEAHLLSSWRAVDGDVFRPPLRAGLLCALVGSGVQIICMCAGMLTSSSFGLLSRVNRGSSIWALLASWELASVAAGYCAARLYASFYGTNRRTVMMTLVSVTAFSIFCAVSLSSTGAVAFNKPLVLLYLWLTITVPFNALGAHIGFEHGGYELPVRTNRIPRAIPAGVSPIGMRYRLAGGFLPFAVALSILPSFFYEGDVLSSLNVFTVAMTSVILVVTCAGFGIIATLMHLAGESYHWWWPSFQVTASSGGFLFAYLVLAYIHNRYSNSGGNHIRIASILVWTAYSAIGSLAFALATGCIGFFASFAYVRKIYAELASQVNLAT